MLWLGYFKGGERTGVRYYEPMVDHPPKLYSSDPGRVHVSKKRTDVRYLQNNERTFVIAS